MNVRKAIAGNFLAGSLGRVIAALIPLVLVPFMIRAWGLSGYGEWLVLTAIPTYIMLSPDLGLAGAVWNQMAISTSRGDRREAICLYRTSWLFLTIMGLLIALVAVFIGHWVSWRHVGVSRLASEATAIIALSCIQIFLVQQICLVLAVYCSARKNPRGELLWSVGSAFYLIVGIATLMLNGSPVVYLSANVAARAIILGVFLFDTRKIMPDFTLGFSGVSLRAIRPYIVPGLGHAGMPLVNALQKEGMLLILGAIMGPVSVAIFQTTRTAVNGAKNLLGLTSTAVVVEIPALVGENRMSAVRRLLVLNTQTALLTVLFWSLLLGLFGEPIFYLWLHHKGVFSESLTLIMVASVFPFALGSSFGLILRATNKIHRAVAILIPGTVLSLAITAVGGYLYGLDGAAMGMLAFESISLVVVCFVTVRSTQISVRETLREAMSRRSMSMAYQSAISVLRSAPAQFR
jgi:O-antigen/teichoic acid export membrane protein